MLNYIEVNDKTIKLNKIVGINFIFSSEYDYSQPNIVHVYLSRIGFNSSFTQAFVTMGEMLGNIDAGEGTLFMLEKKGINKWQIVLVKNIWIA